jgi:hypothetical protein
MKQTVRNGFVGLALALGSMTAATAQVSIGIAMPGVSIGINLPVYPQLVAVPGYPVYYAPNVSANYFFYDGMYWVYQSDNWYASTWYNGPWRYVGPEAVPLYVLRVPVRYYRLPPPYFGGWQADRPPHWDQHWGNDWSQHRRGWDQWDQRAVPPRAPLPTYQRQYSGDRYPRVEQQPVLQEQKYKYKPRDAEVQQHYQQQQRVQGAAPMPQQREADAPRQQQGQPAAPHQQQQQQQSAPRPPEQERGSQGKGSQGSGQSPGQGQDKEAGKGEQGGGDHKK